MRVNKKLHSVVNIFVKLKKEDYEKIILVHPTFRVIVS